MRWPPGMSAGERLLREAADSGTVVDLSGRRGQDRIVRAEVIAALVLGESIGDSQRVSAVRLVGAVISGELNLEHGQLRRPLMLRACRFASPVILDYARAQSIDLRESHFPRLHADGVRVSGNLDLRDAVAGAEAEPGAVNRELAAGSAVRAVGAQIDGDLYAGGITVTGEFNLVGADVGGLVTLRYARLNGTHGVAVQAGGLRIGRGLLMSHMRAQGEVRLPGVHIGGVMRLDGAEIRHQHGRAVSAEALVAQSDVFAEGLRAEGCVYLEGARIGGSLHLDGAALSAASSDEAAISASRMIIDRSLYLSDGFSADGNIELIGMQVDGHLDIVGMRAPDAVLDLRGVHVGDVRDTFEAWPAQVDLDGFTYDSLSRLVSARQRLELLARQRGDNAADRYRPHPYEQLAASHRALGNDAEARTALLAKQRARRLTLPWFRRVPGYFLDAVVGYGYRPLRAGIWAAGLMIAGSVYFAHVHPTPTGSGTPAPYNPVLYTADQLIPIAQFGQQDAWHVHGAPQYAAVALTACGWALGIAIAAAVTRAVTRS